MTEELSPVVLNIVQNEQAPLQAFLRLAGTYRAAAPEQRAVIRAGWPFERRWAVPGLDYSDMDRVTFAPLVGDDAAGLDAQARIESQLTYHAINGSEHDVREMLMDLCFCYHAGLRAGLDVVSLFEAAATVSDDETARLTRRFLRREPEDKSLWAFGVREDLIENGIAFQWIGNDKDYDALKPTRLDGMGREVKD